MKRTQDNQEKPYKYDAFISYRHTEPDKTIAERLQKMLEGYRAPAGVSAKYGINRIDRVFRDRDELPTSGNLGADIQEALGASRCLIVICSPRTPLSKWCRKEIETFRELHGNENILALLIEGEPGESFPYELLHSCNGVGPAEPTAETAEYEPLAADIRASSLQKSLGLLKRTEVLRLIAPILGCEFAELKQRQKERRLKRIIAVSTSAAVLSVAVGTIILMLLVQLNESNQQLTAKNEEIVQKNDSILINNSRYLADEANKLFNRGDRLRALMVALEALPKDLNDPERPFVAEAENTLMSIYNSDAYGTFVLDTNGIPVNVIVSPDGKYIVSEEQEANNQRAFTVWEAANGNFVAKLANVPVLYNNARITEDSRYVVIRDLYWDIRTGKMLGLYGGIQDEIVAFYPNYGYLSPTGRFWVELNIDNTGSIRLTERPSGKQVVLPGGENQILVFFADDSRALIKTGDSFDIGGNNTHTSILDTATGRDLADFYAHVGYSFTCASNDNRYTALQVGSDMIICDTATMTELAHLTDTEDVLIQSNTFLYGPRAFFSNDGSYLAFQNNMLMDQLKVWDWKNDRLLTWYPYSNSSGDSLKHDAPGALTLNSSYCEIFVNDPLFSADDKKLLTVDGLDVHVNLIDELTSTDRFGFLYDTIWSKRHQSLTWSTIRSISNNRNYKDDSNDMAKIREIVLKGHTDTVACARFLADDSRIITSSKDNTIRLWDTRRMPSDEKLDYEDAFDLIWKDIRNPIGDKRILAPTEDTKDDQSYRFNISKDDETPLRSIALKDAETGKEIARLRAKSGYICKAFPQAGNLSFVTESTSNVVDVWDMATGRLLNEVDAGPDHLIDKAGTILAIYDYMNHTIRILGGGSFDTVLYDGKLPDYTEKNQYLSYSNANRLYFFNDETILGVVDNGKLYTFTINEGSLTRAYPELEFSLNDEITDENRLELLSVQGDSLCIGSNSDQGSSTLSTYDMKTGKRLYAAPLEGSIQQIAAAGDSVWVDTRSVFNLAYDRLYTLDAATGSQVSCIVFDSAIRDILPMPDGTVLISQADGTLLHVYPRDNEKKPLSISIQNDFMSVFDNFSPDARYVTLIDDKNTKQYIYDFQRDSIIAQYFHADQIDYCADGSGYYVYERDQYHYCRFMTAAELMDRVKREIASAEAELTPDQRKQYFID